jgi:flagellar operon protein (TIGR03826 family)
MSDVRNCKKCGKVFTYLGGLDRICGECKKKDEEDFKKVKEYLYDNPRASLTEVSDQLQVSVQKITKFLKDGRLEIVGDEANMVLQCESCGKSIRSGRYCDLCQNGLKKDLASTAQSMNEMSAAAAASSESKKPGTGMKFLNKDEKGRR